MSKNYSYERIYKLTENTSKIELDSLISTEDINNGKEHVVNKIKKSLDSYEYNDPYHNNNEIQINDDMEMIKEQDDVLDDMSIVLSRLSNMSSDITDELQLHNSMISDVDNHMDLTNNRINNMQKQLEQLIEKSGCSSFNLILFLLFIAIILFVLLLYT